MILCERHPIKCSSNSCLVWEEFGVYSCYWPSPLYRRKSANVALALIKNVINFEEHRQSRLNVCTGCCRWIICKCVWAYLCETLGNVETFNQKQWQQSFGRQAVQKRHPPAKWKFLARVWTNIQKFFKIDSQDHNFSCSSSLLQLLVSRSQRTTIVCGCFQHISSSEYVTGRRCFLMEPSCK